MGTAPEWHRVATPIGADCDKSRANTPRPQGQLVPVDVSIYSDLDEVELFVFSYVLPNALLTLL